MSGSNGNARNVYRTEEPPEDWIQTIKSLPNPPKTPAKPSYGFDSPLGCLASNIAAPLYIYASLKGKHELWDELVAQLPDTAFSRAALDMGCGRGMVLLKVAEQRKKIGAGGLAYGIDIFNSNDQTGNSPHATYANVACLGLLDDVVLNAASFVEKLPFADGAFSLVTSSLAFHNVDSEGRRTAVEELARVCAPGASVILLDLRGSVQAYMDTLVALGWRDVSVSFAGVGVMYGMWPCQILRATKPI